MSQLAAAGGRALTGRGVVALQEVLARHRLAALYLLALVPLMVLAAAQPVWSRIDEAQHYDLVDQYAHGVYPRVDATWIRPETYGITLETGIFRTEQYGAANLDPQLQPRPPSLGGDRLNAWASRHRWQYSYEAGQGPLFYLAAVPVWLLGNALGGPWSALFALRFLNAVLGAALAPIAALVCRRLLPGSIWSPLAAGLLAALMPGFVLDASQVTNDTLAADLGGLSLLLAADYRLRGWTGRRALAAGACLGLALLAKATAAGLALGLGLALVWPDGRPFGTRARQLVAALAGGASTLAPWLAVNLWRLGSLTQLAQARSFVDHPPGGGAVQQLLSVADYYVGFWGGLPYYFTFAASLPLVLFSPLLALLATMGLVRLARRAGPHQRGVLGLCAAAVLGQAALAPALPALLGGGFNSPGRYAYPALAGICALLAAGLRLEVPQAGWRGLLLAAYAVLAGHALLVYATEGPIPPPRLELPATPDLAVSGTGSALGLRVSVDAARLDLPRHRLWLHLVAENDGRQTVEWNAVPDSLAVAGRSVGSSLYHESTAFDGYLRPGERAQGWVAVGLFSASDPFSSGALLLRFDQIAPHDYHSLASITLAVRPSLEAAGPPGSAAPYTGASGSR